MGVVGCVRTFGIMVHNNLQAPVNSGALWFNEGINETLHRVNTHLAG